MSSQGTPLRFDERDGRTVAVCVVRYGEVATVDDGGGSYRETIRYGAFRDQVNDAKTRPLRIWCDYEHRRGRDDHLIGHAVAIYDLGYSALHAALQVDEGVEGDEMLGMIREGTLTGASMSPTPLASSTVGGVTHRTRMHLTGVSLCRNPAYADGRILGIRRAKRADQPGPSSTDERILWELEGRDAKLRALIGKFIDDNLAETQERRRLGLRTDRSRYQDDPRYQTAVRLLGENATVRAELEGRLRPLPDRAVGAAVRPKILRRELSGPITIR